MDVSVGSEANESQATQLIHDLLEDDSGSSKRFSDPRSSGWQTRLVQSSNELSPDSLPSSRLSNSLPQYHFHGLASTQTQPLHAEGVEEAPEGSQKENIGAQKTGKDNGRGYTSPSPPQASPSKVPPNMGKSFSVVSSQKKGPSHKMTSLATATVAFQSPVPRPATRNSNPLKPMLRSNSPRRLHTRSDSQDSFACDPEKPEEQYLARSDKFALPLSELGKHPSPTRIHSDGTSLSSYHKNSRQSHSPPTGRVLVEATPSNSGSSQCEEPLKLSQQLEATQLVDDQGLDNHDAMAIDKDGSGSGYESSEPSSSYGRFLDGKRGSEPELQATQPSTQVDDSSGEPFAEDAIPWSNVRSAPRPPAASGPQSLLSMVPPQNRWRYRRHLPNGTSSVQTGKGTMPSSLGLASDRRSGESPHLPQMGRKFPVNASNTGVSPPKLQIRQPSPMNYDAIVPDSDPMIHQEMQLNSRSPAVRPAQPLHLPVESSPVTKDCVKDSDVDMDGPENVVHPRKEEEEEEEDIPLASMAQKRSKSAPSGKGKGMTDIPTDKTSGKGKVSATTKGKRAAKSTIKPLVSASKSGRSWETTEVPSSVPEQDNEAAKHNLRNVKSEKQQALKNKPHNRPAPPRTQPRRGSKAPAPSTSLYKQETGIVTESDDEPLMQTTSRDGTEPVEDEYMGDDGVESKKRKRTSSRARASNTRGASKRAKRNAPSPVPRQSKRLRSALSTTSKVNFAEATRVFALWKQDSHYYPGIIYSTNADSEYLVRFDDETESWVKLDQLRLCKLRVGDEVLIANRYRPSRVVNVDNQDEGEIQVYMDETVKSLQISSLRIANKTISYDWGDRVLTPQSIFSVLKPVKPRLSPSPSKFSLLSVPLVRGGRKKVLARTGLIVTLTASNGNWEKEKERAMAAVKNSGGLVIDDLATIIRMEGKHFHCGNAWIIKKTDVEWIGDEEIERLFLVADEPNQKPKYLIALALGIPCLNTEWLHESVNAGEEKDWLGYLLAQGFSNALDSRPTQQVDMDWGNSHHHLTKIMTNPVPSKLFANQSILCVGPDMVPQLKGKRRAGVEGKAQEAMNALPRIILAMGAETVEAVTESRLASKELSDYDCVVIRESTHYSSEFASTTTVHWAWVKECLIASRCLPLPTWPSALEYSQEA